MGEVTASASCGSTLLGIRMVMERLFFAHHCGDGHKRNNEANSYEDEIDENGA